MAVVELVEVVRSFGGTPALDGVSLTIAEVHDDGGFDVALIPETLSRTTLGRKKPGDRLNVEADILAKTVVHWLERTAGRGKPSPQQAVTMELLRDAGFAS